MPRKFLRRWIPHHKHHAGHRSLRWLGPLARDPYLFHLNRHSVSVAFFVGIFSAFIPLPGQTLIAAGLALLFRCNLPLSVLLIWITNPFTFAPIFFLCYELGRWVLQTPPLHFSISLSWDWLASQGQHVLLPLLVGSLLAGLVFGGLGYLGMQSLWRWTVVRNWQARNTLRRARENKTDSGQ